MTSATNWYRANRERAIEKALAYQKAHPEKVSEWQAAYYRRNAAMIQAKHANRAARKASVFRDGFASEC